MEKLAMEYVMNRKDIPDLPPSNSLKEIHVLQNNPRYLIVVKTTREMQSNYTFYHEF